MSDTKYETLSVRRKSLLFLEVKKKVKKFNIKKIKFMSLNDRAKRFTDVHMITHMHTNTCDPTEGLIKNQRKLAW